MWACPRKSWTVIADLPADPGGGAREVVIEASHEPTVYSQLGELIPTSPATWPGRATYLVPAGDALARVQIRDYCNTSCGECPVPSGANLSVIGIRGVKTWHVEVRGEPQETPFASNSPVVHRVYYKATSPVSVRVESSAERPTWRVFDNHVLVEWNGAKPGTTTWTPVLAIEGVCADPACTPPTSAKLEITQVVAERYTF